MALCASLLSVALMVILGEHLTAAQVLTIHPLTAAGTCVTSGLFPNPADCNGYLQCARGQPTPYVKKCSPGTLFHPERRECLGHNSVVCFPRPRTDHIIHAPAIPATAIHAIHPAIAPTVFQAVAAPTAVLAHANTVVLRLFDPLLRPDQCNNIGQQMTRYIRQLVSNNQPSCGANTVCQHNLPVFRVDCLTNNGRLVV